MMIHYNEKVLLTQLDLKWFTSRRQIQSPHLNIYWPATWLNYEPFSESNRTPFLSLNEKFDFGYWIPDYVSTFTVEQTETINCTVPQQGSFLGVHSIKRTARSVITKNCGRRVKMNLPHLRETRKMKDVWPICRLRNFLTNIFSHFISFLCRRKCAVITSENEILIRIDTFEKFRQNIPLLNMVN